jgi:mRNA interferase MazF
VEHVPEGVIRQRSVVILPFPFSDLQRRKARPAVIISNNKYNRRSNDVVAVPLTSSPRQSEYNVPVTSRDMESGELVVDSNARLDKIFSVEKGIIAKRIGTVDRKTHAAICDLLSALTSETPPAGTGN